MRGSESESAHSCLLINALELQGVMCTNYGDRDLVGSVNLSDPNTSTLHHHPRQHMEMASVGNASVMEELKIFSSTFKKNN